METAKIIERLGVPIPYPHVDCIMLNPPFGSYRYVNSAHQGPFYVLKPISTQGERNHNLSFIEKLPFDIMAQIMERLLDMASTTSLACTSFALRNHATSLPLVKRIRESRELARPFVLFQCTNLAKYFSLEDFGTPLTEFSCSICGV